MLLNSNWDEVSTNPAACLPVLDPFLKREEVTE